MQTLQEPDWSVFENCEVLENFIYIPPQHLYTNRIKFKLQIDGGLIRFALSDASLVSAHKRAVAKRD